MKIKRICAGYYSWEYKGYKGTISKVEGENYWYFLIGENQDSGDWHTTYSDTKLAIIEYVDYLIKENIKFDFFI